MSAQEGTAAAVLAGAQQAGPLPALLAVTASAPVGVSVTHAQHALWATAGSAFRAALAFQSAFSAARCTATYALPDA